LACQFDQTGLFSACPMKWKVMTYLRQDDQAANVYSGANFPKLQNIRYYF